MILYTIGHSNHPIDVFLQPVADKEINQLVDIRSRPYSRFNPQFNEKALQQTLLEHGVEYIYLGNSLGGRPSDPSCYIHGVIPAKSDEIYREVDYTRVMQKAWFIEGIHTLLDLASQQTTCILCSEKDPAHCHRQHLIARYLLAHHPDVTIQHILADGSLINATSIVVENDWHDQTRLPLDF